MDKPVKIAAYDAQAIWGIGGTEAEARADVAQWIDPHSLAASLTQMRFAPMSAALAAHVEANGGNVAFTQEGGVLRTWNEVLDEAQARWEQPEHLDGFEFVN